MSMRVSGLASGMNTDEIIAKLMSASRIPMDKLKQQKQVMEWKRDDYRNLNVKLMAFRDAAFNMRLEGSYMVKKATSSNDAAVSVTGTGSATDGRYSLQIDQLATSATISSSVALGTTNGLQTMLKDIPGSDFTKDAKLKITGAKGTSEVVISPAMNLGQLIGQINNESLKTGVKVSYDQTMDRLFFSSSQTGESSNVSLRMESTDPAGPTDLLNSLFKLPASSTATRLEGTVNFPTGDTIIDSSSGIKILYVKVGADAGPPATPGTTYDFGVTSQMTIDQLIGPMNAVLAKEGISTELVDGKLVMYNAQGKNVEFSEYSSGLLDKLGLTANPTFTADPASTFSVQGKNAKVQFNGIASEYESNNFSILGLNFTAKQETTTPVDIVVNHDIDAAFNSIKSFVDKYNELIDEVNKKISEKKYRDFPPLTDEQRKDMKEDEIKRWEERAKSGTLTNDSILSKALSDMRTTMYSAVEGLPEGQLNALAQIGISNTNIQGKIVSGSYLDKGKLYIDEAKLKQALTDRPEEVVQMFRSSPNDSTLPKGDDGIAIKLHKQVTNILSTITEKAGAVGMDDENYLMGKEMKRQNKRIDDLTRRLEDLEKRYYKQFTAMETYMNRMNSQSAWLAQQFSTGG